MRWFSPATDIFARNKLRFASLTWNIFVVWEHRNTLISSQENFCWRFLLLTKLNCIFNKNGKNFNFPISVWSLHIAHNSIPIREMHRSLSWTLKLSLSRKSLKSTVSWVRHIQGEQLASLFTFCTSACNKCRFLSATQFFN